MEFWMHFFMLLLEHFALHFIIVLWLFRSCFFKIETVYFEVSHVPKNYSIVKDSNADLGVNSKIVQIRPTVNFFFYIEYLS